MSASDTNTGFENAFAEAAYADVKTKAPGLTTYMVGFQILDVNEDETRAAAVFGFKINSTWIYVPVFFINGRIRGMDMMYVKDHDLFEPLQDDWVSYLLSKKPDTLGETEQRDRAELNLRSPDYAYSMRGEGLAKASSVQGRTWVDAISIAETNHGPDVRKEFRSGAFEYRDRYMKQAKSISADAVWTAVSGRKGSMFDVMDFTKRSATLENALSNALDQRPDLKTAAGWFYDLRALKKNAGVVVRPWGGFFRDRLGIDAIMAKMAAAGDKSSGVVRVHRGNLNTFKALMTPEQVSDVIVKGACILDMRKQAEDLVVQVEDPKECLTTPRDTGSYTLISKGGTEHDAYVFTGVRSPAFGRVTNAAVVYYRDGKEGGLYPITKLVARGPAKPGEGIDGELERVTSMKPWHVYVLVFPDGSCSLPIQAKLRETTDYGEFWHIGVGTSLTDGDEYDVCSISDTIYPDNNPRVVTIQANDRQDVSLGDAKSVPDVEYGWEDNIASGDTTSFTYEGKTYKTEKRVKPNDWKLIIRDDATPGAMIVTASGTTVHSGMMVLDLGAAARVRRSDRRLPTFDAQVAFDKALDIDQVNKIQVYVDNGEVVAQDGITGDLVYKGHKEAGVVPLMERYNLSEKSARKILDANPNKGAFYVKGAAKIGDDLSVTWPPDTREVGGSEFGYPTKAMSSEASQVVDSLLPTAGDIASYNILRDEEVTSMIRAAEGGQKDVFDVAMVKGLVKSVDVSEQIDEFLPDLLRGMDRVGRIRFLFYWHLDDFEERYGRQDVVELDDSLKTVFKAMGDLILFLHRRTLENQPELRSMDMTLSNLS